jgi:protein O-GlcNAc transferase
MGVPVLTLRGQTHAGRTGASLLKQVGLDALVAETVEAYVDTAVALADGTNHWRSAERRTDLRGRMKAAPLCRPEIFVPNLEQAYREMAAVRRAVMNKG